MAEQDAGQVDPRSEPILDEAALAAVRQVMTPPMMSQLLEVMERTSRETLKLLFQHLEANDLAAAQRAAHKMKGSAGNLGLRRLWRVAMSVEGAQTMNEARQSASDMTNLLEESLSAIRSATQA